MSQWIGAPLRDGGDDLPSSIDEFRAQALAAGCDEVFSTGNHSKVVPVTRIDDRHLQPGPVAKKARELYWDYAHSGTPN